MTLYALELENAMNKDNKIFFDDSGCALYGEDKKNIVFAEGLELSSGYKIPPCLYVKDLENAFRLGMRVGQQLAHNDSF